MKSEYEAHSSWLIPILAGIEEAADLLGISRSTFLKWDASGLLGPMSVSPGGIRRRLWIVEELREWVQAGMPRREEWVKAARAGM